MKIISFKGGLGNQMFEYVFYLWLKLNYKGEIYGYYGKKNLYNHNGFELENVFENINLPKQAVLVNLFYFAYKVFNIVHLKEDKNAGLENGDGDFSTNRVVFDGYWQNLRFFDENIKYMFKFNESVIFKDKKNENLFEQLQNNQTVSIHIRRGDYLNAHEIYGDICNKSYYHKAIDEITKISKTYNPILFVFFSDDIEWVKSEFDLGNSVYVDWNQGQNAYIDMYLMSQCNHNIIANSTFSWWGAYLNLNPNKIVIAPRKWFNSTLPEPNIFPNEWIRI